MRILRTLNRQDGLTKFASLAETYLQIRVHFERKAFHTRQLLRQIQRLKHNYRKAGIALILNKHPVWLRIFHELI